jgi:hypothetical protein
MDVVEFEGESEADVEFWLTYPETDPDLRDRVEALRPPRPFWIPESDPGAMSRWAVAWRVAARYALSIGVHEDERELRQYVWFSARSLFSSDLPTL